eukprot:3349906-Prymnesium_polylepis.2
MRRSPTPVSSAAASVRAKSERSRDDMSADRWKASSSGEGVVGCARFCVAPRTRAAHMHMHACQREHEIASTRSSTRSSTRALICAGPRAPHRRVSHRVCRGACVGNGGHLRRGVGVRVGQRVEDDAHALDRAVRPAVEQPVRRRHVQRAGHVLDHARAEPREVR